jgi:hypothetical protein
LFGGGVALTDFFNPLAMFRSTVHQNHLKKSFFWVEVDEDCDEECGYAKIYEILSLAAQHYANNYKQMVKKVDHDNTLNLTDDPATITPLKVVDARGSKVNILMQKISKSYMTDIEDLPLQYDSLENGLPFFTVWDADFTTVNGKRYFGSRVSSKELFTARLHRIGQYSSWWYDNSQTFGLAKASETYPDFIYIETQNYVDQMTVNDPNKKMVKCQGDLMVTKGKVTFMHLFPHCGPIRLEDSNMINAQVHDARSEIFTEAEWQRMLAKENGTETASN